MIKICGGGYISGDGDGIGDDDDDNNFDDDVFTVMMVMA